MSELTLTKDQQNAYNKFSDFILDPFDRMFVLEGYSGTGKSTLVEKLIEDLPKLLKTKQLIDNNPEKYWDILLTATTNKAAENLSFITGKDVTTIHSALGLRVMTDYKTGKSRLKEKDKSEILTDTVLFIDEASYIDNQLLDLIQTRTKGCKIVFIGDPAQLLTVGCKRSPVFQSNLTTAKLEQVVRQTDGSPITDLATKFRHTVNGAGFFSFAPDGESVTHMPREQFEQEVAKEFTRNDWSYKDSKVLSWTNKCAINFNKGIRNLVTGDPKFSIGDYAICNQYVYSKKGDIKTDQLVLITDIMPMVRHGLKGNFFELDNRVQFFMPDCRAEWKRAVKEAQDKDELEKVAEMTTQWVDLRAAYACTINKAQGSTYDRVFIDLDDLKKCRDGNQLARMLYVGVSRARDKVVLTGDLV